ncbi:hypothetical protein Sjap_005740 [Stephania japonica]|uniref:Uncharacterized protein n=1 Tax=Stephania japonica TaxID=461633 RepID=A0AAP0PJ36_9MAGN
MGFLDLICRNNVALYFFMSLLALLYNHYLLTVVVAAERTSVHIVYLGEKQHHDPKVIKDSHHGLLAQVLGSKEEAVNSMMYSYKHGFSGFAAKLTLAQAQQLSELPGVIHVVPNRLHRIQTTHSWDYLGLSPDSPNNLLNQSNMGDGAIIGVLDTGIWPESKVFDDKGLGPIPSRWKGICQPGQLFNSTNCNKKLIGARWFNKGLLAEYGKPINTSDNMEYLSPRDALGHGTHVSSIAGGSFVPNVTIKDINFGTVRGGAPKVRLAMYKVCWLVEGGGHCSSADILKAFDEAIHDGVDVLSLSIGFAFPLYSDVDERDGINIGSFHAVAKGISVVCAAGNDGPFAQTVANTAPWIVTVAASTIDRSFPTPITLGDNQTIVGQAMYTGEEIGFTNLVFPVPTTFDPSFLGTCEDLNLNNTPVAGNVVLCFARTTRLSALTHSVTAVKTAGGVGVIIANNPSNNLFPCYGSDFPCLEVDYELGTKILYYIRSNSAPKVKLGFSRILIGKPVPTKIAYFSSKGPNSIAPAILKPDIAAPGNNIIAATAPNDPLSFNGYTFYSGTSMATPHVAGIVALLKSVHPNWSPATLRSAITTTAWTTDPSGEPIFAEGGPRKLADPFDYGSGIVNPNKAVDPGLLYDMGQPDYVHYLCSMGYNNSVISQVLQQPTLCPNPAPSILDVNVPSITVPSLTDSVTLSRRVTNVGPVNSIYKVVIEAPLGIIVSVRPGDLVFSSAVKEISYSVTISTTHKVNTGYLFGSLTWSDGVHKVRSPISVRTEIIKSYFDDA